MTNAFRAQKTCFLKLPLDASAGERNENYNNDKLAYKKDNEYKFQPYNLAVHFFRVFCHKGSPS